jgi:hypothetical protein
LISFWFNGILLVKNLFSSELTAKLGLKTQVKQIDTFEELVNSNIKLVLPDSSTTHQTLGAANSNLNLEIYNKASKDITILHIQEIFRNDKWITGVTFGENAIFWFEVPIKIIITNASQKLKENCRFRYLPEDYGTQIMLTIASSVRLDKQFRKKLNLR